MERNHAQIVAALRRKAADKSVTAEESEALTAKADELAKKYGIVESTRTVADTKPAEEAWAEFMRGFVFTPQDYGFEPKRGGKTSYNPFGDGVKREYKTYWVTEDKIIPVDWLADLDEDPSRNGNYEFPQEENFSE